MKYYFITRRFEAQQAAKSNTMALEQEALSRSLSVTLTLQS